MSPREERLARNEVLFREVNERITELGSAQADGDLHIVCECATTGCRERLCVSIEDYQRTRQHPRRFLVVPGHIEVEVEDLVAQCGAYDVVEKHPEVMPPDA